MFKFIRLAIKAMFANPVRTGLTTLGIVIGISTVILVLSAGQGFTSYIKSQMEAYGSNIIIIETKVPPTTKTRNAGGNRSFSVTTITTLKNKDVQDIKRVANVSGAYGAVFGQKVVSYKNVAKSTIIFGSEPARFSIDNSVLANGRPYTDQEETGAAQVAILGADISQDLFGNEDPVNKIIRIGDYNFLVIGVYERRGSIGFNSVDQQVFVPLRTAQKKIMGIDYLFYILAKAKNPDIINATAEDITLLLRSNHSISDPAKDDFTAQSDVQGLETFGTILSGITLLLIGIASISLIVGGVGIMNTMYVIVTERISEIGLKKAVGAKNSDILYEFLAEAILITILGGIFGILLGALFSFGVAKIATAFGFTWAFSVPLSGVILGLGTASAIGLIFGVFPARRAAKLDPVEAMRYE